MHGIIKYLGSKRRLVSEIGDLLEVSTAACDRRPTALDLFTGTTRVAQEFKRRGAIVTAVDTARYSHVFAECYISTDAATVDHDALRATVEDLNALPGTDGYVTETFCRASRFFRPENGSRIDAIRDRVRVEYDDDPILLTSLIEAADRVDSTTGVQMAYLKQWAPRAFNPLELRIPNLLAGGGDAIRADAATSARRLGGFDFAYLDPPYNQHRYYTNYHVWETLVAWDAPEAYGIAQKRVDARDEHTKSDFNKKRVMPSALSQCIESVDAATLVLSYNDESWIPLDDLVEMCSVRGPVRVLRHGSRRYVGAQIGIHSPTGERVGEVSHLHNTEYLVVCGAGAASLPEVSSPRSARPGRRAAASPRRV